jgi:hypothetical protein
MVISAGIRGKPQATLAIASLIFAQLLAIVDRTMGRQQAFSGANVTNS